MTLFLISTYFTQHLLNARPCVTSSVYRDEIYHLTSRILYSTYLYPNLFQEGFKVGLKISNITFQCEFYSVLVL